MVDRYVTQAIIETEILNEDPTVRATQALLEVEVNIFRDVYVTQVLLEVEIAETEEEPTPRYGIPGLATPRPYTVQLYERTGDETQGNPHLLLSRLNLHVNEISYAALGGCDAAIISATGPEAALWHLADMLLAGVEIYDGHDALVWWGYIDELEINVGNVQFGVSLSSMSNRVAVAYAYVGAGFASAGTRETTDWNEDADSVAEYGTFELLDSLSQAEELEAEMRRDALLAQYRYPMPVITFGGDSLGATLHCRGWFHLLKRRYYGNAGSDYTIETTSQIEAIVDEVGDHLRGVEIVDPSGVFTADYRDGDSNAWSQIEELLETGTENYRRLLCNVTPDRILRVYEEPAAGSVDNFLTAQGQLLDRYARPLRPSHNVVGIWARLKDVVPPSVDMTKLADPSLVFIERATFVPDELAYRFEYRGPSPLALGRIRPG